MTGMTETTTATIDSGRRVIFAARRSFGCLELSSGVDVRLVAGRFDGRQKSR